MLMGLPTWLGSSYSSMPIGNEALRSVVFVLCQFSLFALLGSLVIPPKTGFSVAGPFKRKLIFQVLRGSCGREGVAQAHTAQLLDEAEVLQTLAGKRGCRCEP